MTYPITPDPAIHNLPATPASLNPATQELAFLQQFWAQLPQEIVQGLVNAILNALGLGNFVGPFDAMLTAVENALKNIPVANIIGALNSIDQALRDAIADLLGGTGTGVTLAQLQQFLKQAFQGVYTALLDFADGTLGIHPLGNLEAFLDGTIQILENTPGGNALAMVFNNLDGTVTAIADTMHNAALNAKTLGTSVGGQVGQIANFFIAGNKNLTTLESGLQQQFAGIATAIQDNFDGTVSLLTGMIDNLDGTVGGVISQIGNIGKEIQTVIDNADGTLTGIGTFLANLGNFFGTHAFHLGSIQQILDALHITVNNDLSTGNPVGSFLTNLETMMQTLFNQNSLGTELSQFVTPNVLKAMSTDIQGAVDNAVNTLLGGNATGNPIQAMITAFLNMPQLNVVPVQNPSATGTISHNASANTFNAGGSSNYTQTLGITVTGNYLTARICYVASTAVVAGLTVSATPWVTTSITYGGLSMTLLSTASQVDSSGNTLVAQIWGLMNPAVGTGTLSVTMMTPSVFTHGTSGLIVATDDYTGVGSVGTGADLTGSNGSPSMSISSATNDEVVNVLAVYTENSVSEALSSYNQTSRSNVGSVSAIPAGHGSTALIAGDGAGAGSVTFSATGSFITQDVWAGAAVNLIPSSTATIGSGFKVTNTSATATAVVSGNSVLPNSFYTVAGSNNTGDYTYTAGTSNQLKVANAGWYKVTVSILMGTAGANFGPALYHNGSIYEIGSMLNTANTGVGPYKEAFLIYCLAGDTLQPGYSSSAASGTVAGEATGTKCYFSATLANRSIY